MSADIRSMLMEAIAARSGAGAGVTPQELLARMAGADPAMTLLAQYLTQRQGDEDENEDEDEDDGGEREDGGTPPEPAQPSPSPEFLRAVRGLRRKAALMFAELEELRERNDTLAAALGACYLCWGEDPACEVCGGTGRPGSMEPDRRLFAELVLPAARRLQRREEVVRRAR